MTINPELLNFIIHYSIFIGVFIVSSIAWTIVHEFSHLIAAKLTCGVDWWEMKVRPCELNGRKVGGYVRYSPIRPQTNIGRAIISLAPFLISIPICIMLPMLVLTKYYILTGILLGGVIDQIGGAVVPSDTFWDLPHAAEKLKIPLWLMRTGFILLAAISIVVSVYIFIINIPG